MQKFKGKAFIFGDDIDTAEIIPARFLAMSEPDELGKYCLVDVDPEFVNKVGEGDMVVAGKNFGCGPGWEQAALALKGTDISCVIAKSFGRIFFRNAINTGLPILQCPEAFDSVNQGDELEVDLRNSKIRNKTKGETYVAESFPPMLQKIIESGGLMTAIEKGVLK